MAKNSMTFAATLLLIVGVLFTLSGIAGFIAAVAVQSIDPAIMSAAGLEQSDLAIVSSGALTSLIIGIALLIASYMLYKRN